MRRRRWILLSIVLVGAAGALSIRAVWLHPAPSPAMAAPAAPGQAGARKAGDGSEGEGAGATGLASASDHPAHAPDPAHDAGQSRHGTGSGDAVPGAALRGSPYEITRLPAVATAGVLRMPWEEPAGGPADRDSGPAADAGAAGARSVTPSGVGMVIHEPAVPVGFTWSPQDGPCRIEVDPGKTAWISLHGPGAARARIDGRPAIPGALYPVTGNILITGSQTVGVHVRPGPAAPPAASG